MTHRVAMAESVHGTVRDMDGVGTKVSEASEALSRSAGETFRLAGSVAAAAEEQAASIGEVAMRTTETARKAEVVGDSARLAQSKLNELVSAVSSISEVVAAVSSIAGQTKLLALNATIEAARAGEVGRGFAVVASEVKALSDQTAKSTEEIGARIGEIQTETQKTAEAVSRVIAGIGDVVQLVERRRLRDRTAEGRVDGGVPRPSPWSRRTPRAPRPARPPSPRSPRKSAGPRKS